MKKHIAGTLTGIVMTLSGCAALQTIQATIEPWTTWEPTDNYRINAYHHYDKNIEVTPATSQHQGYIILHYNINNRGGHVSEYYEIHNRKKNIVAREPCEYRIDRNGDGIIDKVTIVQKDSTKTASTQ